MIQANIYRFILYPARQLYRKIFRPKTCGVKVIIKYKNEILLIKNTYGNNLWNLPGGGVKKNEPLSEAAKREIKEEVGIKLKVLKKIGSFLNDKEYIKDTVTLFIATVKNKNTARDRKEIKAITWVDLNKLPNRKLQASPLQKSLELLSLSNK